MIRRAAFALLSLSLLSAFAAAAEPGGWPLWRGPGQSGIASAQQDPPTTWSGKENVVWSAAVPGRGHGSPVVAGGRVYLCTADVEAQRQEVVCYDRDDGGLLWRRTVHQGGLEVKGNKKASLASSTPACDGERLVVNFLNGGAVHTTALRCDDGEQLWQTKISDYVVHQGYGTSPTLYENLAVVAADNKGGGAIAALDLEDGRVVWSNRRPKKPNYVSPRVVSIGGRDQLLMIGCDLVSGFDPRDGSTLWEFPGATTECVATTVTDGRRVFTSGGYPKNHVAAFAAGGDSKPAWINSTRVYVPSMIVDDGHLYAVADAGVALCWNCETGQELWKRRLPGGGAYSSSPVRVGDRMYATSERGSTAVFTATPGGFELLAANQLGDLVMASPAICGGRIYQRVAAAAEDGKLAERLYCLGRR